MTDDPRLILLAEDDDVLRFLCMRQLEKLGYTAHYAKNGREALNLVEQFVYQAILMDMMMPDVDGCEATKLIRQFDSDHGRKHTPIIAITAYEDKTRCTDAGMDDYLFKPVLLEDLRLKLEQWIH